MSIACQMQWRENLTYTRDEEVCTTINEVKGGTLAKSRKLFFQGRPFLEGKIQKMQKKISKNFIVPNRLLGHTDHL